MIWWYLRLRFTLWLLRAADRLLRWLALTAVLAAAAPVTIVAAAWSLPMTGAYLTGRGLHAATWHAFELAPVRDWQAAWNQGSAGRLLTAFALTAPVAVPAGLAAAAGLWAWRIYAIETGLSGRTATAPVVFDARQWRRASRAARGRVTAPGAFPLTTRDGQIVMGATIRAVGHRWQPVTAISYRAMGRHQVIVGSSGSGKTSLMMRTWAGWYAAALQDYYRHRAARPLLVVLDCKGGPDARVKAERTRRLLHAAGARRVAVWPDQAAVQVSAQSWQGLGATDDERYRIAATADGGIWLMRTPYPQPVCELAGTRRVIETATKVTGGVWGDQGSSRVQHAWNVDPGIARRLAVGQAACIRAGGCTWVQIARPRPSPLPLPAPPPEPAVVIPPAQPEASPAAVPAPPADLDDVFGQEARP